MGQNGERIVRKDTGQTGTIILEQARKLFAEQGVDQISMHQIAKAAGVGQGTLYRRYAHKGELCLDLLLDIFQKSCEEIDSYLLCNQNATLEERLYQALAFSIDFIEEQCQLLSAIKAPNCEDDRTITYHSPIYSSRHETFRKLLEEVPGDRLTVDATYTADLILAALAPNFFNSCVKIGNIQRSKFETICFLYSLNLCSNIELERYKTTCALYNVAAISL